MIQFQASNFDTIKTRLESLGATNIHHDGASVVAEIPRAKAFDIIKKIKEDPETGFRFFTDITGADFLKYSVKKPERYAVIYILLSPSLGVRLELIAYLPENDPSIQSIASLFTGANWAERETYDMYGFEFKGHPSPGRLLTPEGFEGHALRKDYPLKGKGERSSFPVYRATPGHASE